MCDADISPFYDLSSEVVRINTQFIVKASWENNIGKTLGTGRVVVLNNGVSLAWSTRFVELIVALRQQHSRSAQTRSLLETWI